MIKNRHQVQVERLQMILIGTTKEEEQPSFLVKDSETVSMVFLMLFAYVVAKTCPKQLTNDSTG